MTSKTKFRLGAGKPKMKTKMKTYQQKDVAAAAAAAVKETADMLIAEKMEVTVGEAEPEPGDVEPANTEDFFAMLPTGTPCALLVLSFVPCHTVTPCHSRCCLSRLPCPRRS